VTTLRWPDDSLCSLVIRTDYADDPAWAAVRSAIETPVTVTVHGHEVGPFLPIVELVDDSGFDRLTVQGLLELAAESPDHSIAFLVDGQTLSAPDHPILAVDLAEEPGRTFRVMARQLWNVQTNVAVGNAGWDDYAEYAGPDGVLRGLPTE